MTTHELEMQSLDTLRIITSRGYVMPNKRMVIIDNELKSSIRNTQFYSEQDKVNISSTLNLSYQPTYEVENCTTTNMVEILNNNGIYDDICILNFASAIKPGGGWLHGRVAQEEDICRKTTLFNSIVNCFKFYKESNSKNPLYPNDIIYSPDVILMKNDNFELIDPIKISVITSAAINKKVITGKLLSKIDAYNKNNNTDLIDLLMIEKIKKIIEVAILNEQKYLVLGAFGCGVFGNEPKKVAKYFKYVLKTLGYEKYFKCICFAIYDTNNTNITEFEKVFLR